METTAVLGFVGVYQATWDLKGALHYVKIKLTGEPDCALCEVTHSSVTPKKQWRELVSRLGVPFDLVHLNQLTDEIVEASGGTSPCVLVRTSDGLSLLLGPQEIEDVAGDVATFESALRAALAQRALVVP